MMEIILTLLILMLPAKGGKPHQMKDIAALSGIAFSKGVTVVVATPDGKKMKIVAEKSRDLFTNQAMGALSQIPEVQAIFDKPKAIKSVNPEDAQIVVLWGDQKEVKDRETKAFLKKLKDSGRAVLVVGEPLVK